MSTAQFETTRRKPSVWRLRFSIWAIGSRRSPWFHPAAAPSKSAPMANLSIPSSIPANGRISTPSSGKSKRHLPDGEFGSQETRKLLPDAFFRFWLRGFQIQFLRRVKGAWWPSRSSKSPSALTGRGRFDSYPLRLFSAEDQSGCNACEATARLSKQESRKKNPSKRSLFFFLVSWFPNSTSSPFERR